MPIISYLKSSRRFSFSLKDGGSQRKTVEQNDNAEGETEPEEEEQVKYCLVFLVRKFTISNGCDEAAATYFVNVGRFTSDRERGAVYLDQSAAQDYFGAAAAGFKSKGYTRRACVGDSRRRYLNRGYPICCSVCARC